MAIMATYWTFLSDGWPVVLKGKYHRTELKSVKDVQYLKSYVLEHLGYIPVFFFLVVLFGDREYPGPYRGVEKGLLLLYQLLTGCSIAQMARFVPPSSFHAIYREFYIKHGGNLGEVLDRLLRDMFSSAKIRIMCAIQYNPENFKHVTLMIDGHDSRATYLNAKDHTMYYSYKLKKSGFRTQVCTDINGMVLFVSKSAPCAENNDGSMLADMKLKRKITKYDCVVVDGGYTLFLDRILARNSHLGEHNFVAPIRKQRHMELTEDEVKYNTVLGSFRSAIEATFGEIGHLFHRFNGKSVIRVADTETFTVQFKLACILHNLKKFVRMGNIPCAEHHTYWMQPEFDYDNGGSTSVFDNVACGGIGVKKQHADVMEDLQQQLLLLDVNDQAVSGEEDDISADEHYEVEAIVNHRGPKHRREYLVKWVGYSDTSNSWLTAEMFDTSDMVKDYEKVVKARRSRN